MHMQRAFDEEMTTKQDNLRKLQHELSLQAPTHNSKIKQPHKPTIGTVHEVMQGEPYFSFSNQ